MDCVFCNIIERKAPAEIIYEDEKVIAFLDIKPIHFGHVLVVPKIHSKDFIDIPTEDLHSLINATRIIANALVKSLKPDGYNIFSNNGKAAGQSVFHFHMHITPRYFKDDIHFRLNLKKYEHDEMKDFAEMIKKEINIDLREKFNG
jgi:histidine triad (HIT) family protein